MIKVLTIVGTRPEIIKLSQVIKELDKYTDHILVHTGQNYDYELNELFFEQLDIRRPNIFLESVKGTPSEMIGDIISKADKVLVEEMPDAVLVYGDTNSCLSVIPAKKRKIPIFHMEAGNRCFDQRVPEEVNRKIVDHLSDINMPLSEQARDYLVREGLKPETIIKTGSPMKEVLLANMDMILENDILSQEGLAKREYILMSIHREENVDSEVNFRDLLESINEIAKVFQKKILISTHPRTRLKLDQVGFNAADTGIKFAKPYGFHEYNNLQLNAFCVVSDSGTIAEESSIMNIPAITIRQAHERPEGMDEGTLIMSGLKKDRVVESIRIVTQQYRKERAMNIVKDYDVDNVSKKVLRIIVSYIEYINRTVWHKY